MDDLMATIQKKELKTICSRIGFALFATLVTWLFFSFLTGWLIETYAPTLLTNSWIIFGVNSLPLYLFGFPVFLFIIKKLPNSQTQEKQKLSLKQFLLFLVISFAAMYITSFISVILTQIISLIRGVPVINPIDTIPKDNIWAMVLFVGILAPVMEEIIFRGFLINKLKRFGDTVCIFASGFAFGLFHGNLSQMLYAFVLGMIFAYMTIKTGTILYAVILHMIINLQSVALSPLLAYEQNLFLMLVMMIIGLYVLSMLVLGITFFVINIRKIKLNNDPNDIKPTQKIKVFLLNPGIIIYTMACIALVVMMILR